MITILDQIANQFTGIPIRNQSAFRHGYDDVITTSAGTVATTSPLAVLSNKRASEPKIGKRVEPGSRLKIDTAPPAAITAIGSATGNIFLTPKTQAAVAPFSGMYRYCCFINKFHNLTKKKSPAPLPERGLI
jgi:hypothetical protein